MLKEILVKDRTLGIKELSTLIDLSNTYQIDNLCVPSYFIGYIKNSGVSIASQIDFPYGFSHRKIRLEEINYSLDSGCDTVDITINPFMIENKLFPEIHKELKEIYRLCDKKRKRVRAIIEYRLSELVLIDLCDIIVDSGIDTVITSTGTMLDDPMDNLLMTKIIMENTSLSCIMANTTRNEKTYEILKKEGIFGIRCCSNSVISDILGVLSTEDKKELKEIKGKEKNNI